MNSYKGNSIGWTSYNLPSTITAAGQSSQFAYGPNRNRWRQIASYPTGTETTIYVGGILEKVTVPSGTAYRHYIGAGSASVLYTRWSTGTITTKYVTADHLGSSTVVMSDSGNTLVNLSFGSYGARRGSNWTGTPSAGDWTQISNSTRHGFTGHEALDNVNFVHMNGRVFEPVLGRFLSADPFMPGILGSQAPNRYAYVGNRPHSLVDPSGFTPDGDVTENRPTPRNLPQCPYQIANIAVDCPYRYGWRWDLDPFDVWLMHENMVEAWVRAMMAGAASGTNRPPPTRPAPPAPQPGTPEPEPTPPEFPEPGNCSFAPMFEGRNTFPIGDGYGPRTHPITGEAGRMHSGIDILAPQGTPWLSPINGTVALADFLRGSGGGTVVILGSGADSRYRIGGQHLSAIEVTSGQIVNRGDLLGETGGMRGTRGAGGSTGPHLHFYVREAGQMIDPTPCYTGAQ